MGLSSNPAKVVFQNVNVGEGGDIPGNLICYDRLGTQNFANPKTDEAEIFGSGLSGLVILAGSNG